MPRPNKFNDPEYVKAVQKSANRSAERFFLAGALGGALVVGVVELVRVVL